MNNEVQFACLWCCVPPDFVLSLVLFSALIHKRREMKLTSKIIKYKLDSFSKMQFAFFYPKHIQKIFWKIIDFVGNLEMTQTAEEGWGEVGLPCSLRHYEAMHTKIDM